MQPNSLSISEEKMLKLLIAHLPRVKPGDAKTYLGYAQVHERLGLSMHASTYGRSLQIQGLESIARWAQTVGAPAITGIVIDQDLGWPSSGFFDIYGRRNGDFSFWIEQTQSAKAFDWDATRERGRAVDNLNKRNPIGVSEEWLVEITWSKGVIELFDLQTVTEDGAWITTDERWESSSPATKLQYRVFAKQLQDRANIIYELEYRELEQTDPTAKTNARFGLSRITFDSSGTVEAVWTDENDSDFSNKALKTRIVPRYFRTETVKPNISNKLSFTRFLASLDCHLRIGWYWSAASEKGERVIFTIWSDQIEGGKYVLLPKEDVDWKKLPGAYELRRHFPLALVPGVEVYGVVCTPEDDEAVTRKRKYYNERELLQLSIREEDGAWIADIGGVVDVDQVRAGTIDPFNGDAYDDLEPPLGCIMPARVPAGVGVRVIRDAMVRQFVIERAQGACEFCDKPGFPMEDGRTYLECHHVEHLAAGGADTVDNVIALCANDHRESHYGRDRESMSARMLEKISLQNAKWRRR